MPPRKRKSGAADVAETPAKRTRRSTADPATPKTAAVSLTASTPTTGEKRGRGRPRKISDPPATAPLPAKRGPGRPHATPLPSAKDTAQTKRGPARARATSVTPQPKRGPGRPRATPLPLAKQTATTKRGPGRPRKDAEVAKATPPKPVVPFSGRTRGGPKKNAVELNGVALPNGSAARGKKAVKTSEADVEQSDDEDTGRPSYWLMKAEPESRMEKGVDVKFSIDDLREATEPEPWDGVRNFVALKHMQLMKKGDLAFFYHSNCKNPGVAGIMEIVQEHSIDESAFDPNHPYYDEKQRYTRENHKWEVVHVEFRRKFNQIVSLVELKAHAQPGGPLQNLQTLKQSRLSVSAVTPSEWDFIVQLAGDDGDRSNGSAASEKREPVEESKPADEEKPVEESQPDEKSKSVEDSKQDGESNPVQDGMVG